MITTFDKAHYEGLETDELKTAYMTECFGDDAAAKEAAMA